MKGLGQRHGHQCAEAVAHGAEDEEMLRSVYSGASNI